MDNTETTHSSATSLIHQIKEMQNSIEKYDYDSIAMKYIELAQKQNVNFVPSTSVAISISDLIKISTLLERTKDLHLQNIVSIFDSRLGEYENSLQSDYDEAVRKKQEAQKILNDLLQQLNELESENTNFDTMETLFSQRSYRIKHSRKELKNVEENNSEERPKVEGKIEEIKLQIETAKKAVKAASFNPEYYSKDLIVMLDSKNDHETR